MKKLFVSINFCFCASFLFGQLNKDTWLVGGTGNFLSSNFSYTSSSYSSSSNRLETNISGNVGYFLFDKFALGLKLSYSKFKDVVDGSGGNINSNENRLYFGPFVRYYFLKMNKAYNILTEINYQHGFYWFTPTKGNINSFSASIGPVIYFNSNVGLEFLLGYYNKKEVIKQGGNTIDQQKGFQIGIGFQIHLEK